MRIARFRHGARTRYGIVEGNEVAEVRGSIFGRSQPTGSRYPLGEVKLLAPVVPSQMFGPGLNFAEHLAHASGITGQTRMAETPNPWHKGVNALIGPEDTIVIPYDSQAGIQYEGECLAVIGRRARRVSSEEGWACILGYTCGNDVSERGWQRADRSFWRAKAADTFSPIGPWIETEFDPRRGSYMVVRLNGREVQRANTRDMHFDFGTLVSYISQWVTLKPGDIIWSGTTGAPENMNRGDVVEVDVEGVGVLRNRVGEERRPRSRP
ncbi:MAG: fumarylacetoacetate hydrolase family protein [Chloroflexi bacterium]|nr:fumarylacetoacetate hydrolase family protein [Chloroflexota bacterium]